MNKQKRKSEFNQTDGMVKQARMGESSNTGLVFDHNFSKEETLGEKFEQCAQISSTEAIGLHDKSVSIFRFQNVNGVINASKYQFTIKISTIDSLIDGLKAMKNYYQLKNKK